MEKGPMFEDLIIVGGLVLMQAIYAGNSIILSSVLSLGFAPFTVVIFFTFVTFVVIAPAAFLHERRKWPSKFNLKLVIQVVLLAFTGVFLFQILFLEGLKQTSPTIATAMPNLAPGLIFLIAWGFGFEKLDLRFMHSKVKIVGTLICIVGAIFMSIMHVTGTNDEALYEPSFDAKKLIGCLYLLAAVSVMSCNVVLQAATLAEFPAPLSLCALTSLVGVALAVFAQFFQDEGGNFLPLIEDSKLFFCFLMGGLLGAVVVSFNGWALKKRGPVFVSIFSPLSTVLSVIFSSVALGESLNLGSIFGMLLMIFGLYLVLWAKGKESIGEKEDDDLESEGNTKKPLLD